MDIEADALKHLVIDALEDLKGQKISVVDVRGKTAITDYMIIASGRSARQVIALAEKVILEAKKAGHPPMGVEGLKEGEWVLVDLCDVVVHVMQPDTRELYLLEKLWGGRDAEIDLPSRGSAP